MLQAVNADGNMVHDPRVVLPIPDGLFETKALVNCGVSQLRRFQRGGETMEDEKVADRLLLTWSPEEAQA